MSPTPGRSLAGETSRGWAGRRTGRGRDESEEVGDATAIYLVECSPPLACGAGWDDPGAYYKPVRIGARYYPRADADYTRRIVGIRAYLPGTPEEYLPASIVGRVIAELARAGVALPWGSEYVPGLAVGRYFITDSGYLIGTADGALYVPTQYVHAAAVRSCDAGHVGRRKQC